MTKLRLTLACGDYDRTRPLRDGTVAVEGVELIPITLPPEEIFWRMGRFEEFDTSEFSLSSYHVLRAQGRSLIAIPAFPSRAFRHSSIYVRTDAGIGAPADLRGKRVGVPKYHMTAAVWIRGLLEHEYGVAPSQMRWFEGGEGGRVKEVDVALPGDIRVESVPASCSLSAMLEAGELDAFIGARMPAAFAAGSPRIRRLFPDFKAEEQAYYRRTGIFPIMHTVVLRGELHRAHPWLARSLYKAFCQAKDLCLRQLGEATALACALPGLLAELEETRAIMGADPWPYGVERNRKVLETVGQYAVEQGLIPRPLPMEEMFATTTLQAP